jgi:hypothetical protein
MRNFAEEIVSRLVLDHAVARENVQYTSALRHRNVLHKAITQIDALRWQTSNLLDYIQKNFRVWFLYTFRQKPVLRVNEGTVRILRQ